MERAAAASQPDHDQLLSFFKALANDSRLRIVGLLAAGERSGQELAQSLGLSEPTVSHHLAVLRRLGLIVTRSEGVTHWHVLDKDALQGLSRGVFEDAQGAPPRAKESFERRVLKAFVDPAGAVAVIPASRRKRAVLLAWLAEAFEAGRAYPEAEVNQILQRHHWDSATLRRELVGGGWLERERGVYRRGC